MTRKPYEAEEAAAIQALSLSSGLGLEIRSGCACDCLGR